jgi:hypothetical protein
VERSPTDYLRKQEVRVQYVNLMNFHFFVLIRTFWVKLLSFTRVLLHCCNFHFNVQRGPWQRPKAQRPKPSRSKPFKPRPGNWRREALPVLLLLSSLLFTSTKRWFANHHCLVEHSTSSSVARQWACQSRPPSGVPLSIPHTIYSSEHGVFLSASWQ